MIADFRIMISSVLVSVMVGLIFGIMPAIRAGNLDPVDALKRGIKMGKKESWILQSGNQFL